MTSEVSVTHNYTTHSFMGQTPYDVLIDESEELTSLLRQAESYQELPFAEKLTKVQELAVNAMRNAWEGSLSTGENSALARSIVFEKNPLSKALKEKWGCCRYQSTLFLLLGEKAKLGTKHLLQSVKLDRMNTCFNDLTDPEGHVHHISIFALSLSDQKYNYSKDPSIFERPNVYLPGEAFLGYTIDPATQESCLYSRPNVHLMGSLSHYRQELEKLDQFRRLSAQIESCLNASPSKEDHSKLLGFQRTVNTTIQETESKLKEFQALDDFKKSIS
ncbi:MAG: hypothetical protein JSR93_05575 [Verrucomicrobia bacterium]|nr:hypothetical protein [Verrucomicrobiota bacterium]